VHHFPPVHSFSGCIGEGHLPARHDAGGGEYRSISTAASTAATAAPPILRVGGGGICLRIQPSIGDRRGG